MKRSAFIILNSAIALLAAYFYTGFYFPDPQLTGKMRVFILAARAGFPLFFLIVAFVSYRMRTGGNAGAVILVIASIVLSSLILYPVVSYIHDAKLISKRIREFHPYLQISPPPYRTEDEREQKDTVKIFCLGGSTTQYTDKQGNGWPARVEKLLQQEMPGKAFTVLNFGREWYTTQHSLINYLINLRRFKPDVIVVMHTINDLLHNADFSYFSFAPFQNDYRHFHGPVYRLINRPTALQTLFFILRSMWYHKPRDVVVTNRFPGIEPFKRNLKTIIETARLDNTVVVLMTQPNLYKDEMTPEELNALHMLQHEAIGPDKKWAYETALSGMRQYSEAVRDVAGETGVLLIDLEKAVPRSLEYFYDDVHYQKKSFDLIAEYIANKLVREEGLIEVVKRN